MPALPLNYKVLGSGEPLIILHGLFGSLDNWQTLGRKWSINRQVILVDQRNHGRSPHAEDFGYEEMAEDVLQLMDDLSFETIDLMGHSMGGKTAMYLALTRPERIRNLIIADVAPVTYEGGHAKIFNALQSIDFSLINRREEIDEQLSHAIPDTSVRQFLMKGVTRDETMELTWKFNVDALWEHYNKILTFPEALKPYRQSATFIRGGKSNYITEDYWKSTKLIFPKAKLRTIDSAGHWLHAEQPKDFFDMVTKAIS